MPRRLDQDATQMEAGIADHKWSIEEMSELLPLDISRKRDLTQSVFQADTLSAISAHFTPSSATPTIARWLPCEYASMQGGTANDANFVFPTEG